MSEADPPRSKSDGKFTPNAGHRLGDSGSAAPTSAQWVGQNTAILVIHGIGNQQPLETLDPFAETLARAYRAGGCNVFSEHVLAPNPTDDKRTPWFQNVIRLKCRDREPHIDLYEYYWAPETENAATFEDIQAWLRGVVKQARTFYRDQFLKNADLGRMYRDKSLFFSVAEKDGVRTVKFRGWLYHLVISTIGFVIPLGSWALGGLNRLLATIPVVGGMISHLLEAGARTGVHVLANVIGDVTVYNTYNRRSKHWNIRQKILGDAVRMLRRLVEADEKTRQWPYGRIIVTGHSLGSEVAFDTLNRLNLLCGEGLLAGFGRDGRVIAGHSAPVATVAKLDDLLCGLITFGSPLDKVAFFLREEAADNEIYRRQIIENYRGFKQRPWSEQDDIEDWQRLAPPVPRLLDGIRWHNYHDRHDYVSGSLDYYLNLVNVNCAFTPPGWTKWTWCLLLVFGVPWLIVAGLLFLGVAAAAVAVTAIAIYAVLWPGGPCLLDVLQQGWDRISAADCSVILPCGWLVVWTVVVFGLAFGWLNGVFSHSRYWRCEDMHREIIDRFLGSEEPPRHT